MSLKVRPRVFASILVMTFVFGGSVCLIATDYFGVPIPDIFLLFGLAALYAAATTRPNHNYQDGHEKPEANTDGSPKEVIETRIVAVDGVSDVSEDDKKRRNRKNSRRTEEEFDVNVAQAASLNPNLVLSLSSLFHHALRNTLLKHAGMERNLP